MSIFPFMKAEENTVDLFTPLVGKKGNMPIEHNINFETNSVTGKRVNGDEALRIWIYKALNTKRYQYEIYSWDYGCEIEDLIGKDYGKGYIESEFQRYVKECLLINENILDVINFDIKLEKDKLISKFTVITKYGEVEMNV